MKEIEFKDWLKTKSTSNKVISDTVSRLKKLERSLNIDIDSEFEFDKCTHLYSFFDNVGLNSYSASVKDCTLPIGKYYLSTYKLALKKYLKYLENQRSSN